MYLNEPDSRDELSLYLLEKCERLEREIEECRNHEEGIDWNHRCPCGNTSLGQITDHICNRCWSDYVFCPSCLATDEYNEGREENE